MKLSTIAGSFILRALAVSAQVFEGSIVIGGAGPGCYDERVCQAFADAGRNPNATDSVTFTRSFNDTQQEWTWRINITEVAIPEKISDLGDPSADYSANRRLVNTQWELEFPGDAANLEQYLLEVGNTTLVWDVSSTINAANITASYDPSANGDCTSMLGEDCVNSIKSNAFSDSSFTFGGSACRGTLGVQTMQSVGPGGSSARFLPNATGGWYDRGDTFISRNSGAYTAGNTTSLDAAKGSLSVLVLNFQRSPEQFLNSDTDVVVLCRIMDKGLAQTLGEDPADDSAASALFERVPTAYLAGVLILCAFWL